MSNLDGAFAPVPVQRYAILARGSMFDLVCKFLWHSAIWLPLPIYFSLRSRAFELNEKGGGGPQVGEVTRLKPWSKNKTRLHTILRPRGAGVRFLEVVVALAIREFEHIRPKLTSRERRKIYEKTHMYLSMKVSRVVLRGVRLHE